MGEFNLKQWLIEKKAGMYSKTVNNENFGDYEEGGTNTNMVQNRGDLQELDPRVLGVQQDVADAEMQKKDDENGDWVDNASMDVVAEEPNETVGWATITRPADPNLRKLERKVGSVKKNP